MCHAGTVSEPDTDQPSIGILGGTGPAGSGLAARLASIGHTVVIGSRSKYKALEARDVLAERWPEVGELLLCGDNATAAQAEIVVIATPWDGAAAVAQENAEQLAGQDRDLDGQRAGPREQGVPAAGAAAGERRGARPGGRAAAAGWSRRSTIFRRPNSVTSTSRSTPTC